MPIFYECDRCTACCRWPGDVRLADGEAEIIAASLGMAPDDFIQGWTRLNRSRTGLSLEDKPDGSCIFLDGNDCRIQAVKPAQCRGFPNLWNFPGFEQTCRAKPREVTAEEWRRRVEAACGQVPPAHRNRPAEPSCAGAGWAGRMGG